MTSDRRILDLFGIDLPIIQAPMAGSTSPELVIAVSEAGGLGSLPCALLSPDQARDAVATIRAATDKRINLNFFCHTPPIPDAARAQAWVARFAGYYAEFSLDPADAPPAAGRAPFDNAYCQMVEATRPEVVSFHFGLPDADLLARVKATGAKVISSATTVAEARWLDARGCDAIIAMGAEAGGHRGMFLSDDVGAQVGTFALVPQVVDAVSVPVIAAGAIADGRGVAAAFALGASAVQVGTAYLLCPEVKISEPYRRALMSAAPEDTALTNVFTGRPARGVLNRVMRDLGPMSADAPAFPGAGAPLAMLRPAAEKIGSGDFSPLWSGQAASLARPMPAAELTRMLAAKLS